MKVEAEGWRLRNNQGEKCLCLLRQSGRGEEVCVCVHVRHFSHQLIVHQSTFLLVTH